MRLLSYTSSWFALALFVILSGWATVFYLDMLDEIYDSMDDGLENQKILVIQKAARDHSVLERDDFDDGYYKIQEVPYQLAEKYTDTYVDTLIYTLNEEDLEPYRMLKTAFQQNGKYYEMRVITSMVEEDDLIEHLLFALIILYLGLMGSTLLLNNYLHKKIWQPFYHLLSRLKTFQLDDPKPIEVKNSRIMEFNLLNDSVQKLLRSNIQTYNNQKEFIENASHELQTPLAISLNKLELLVENHSIQEEQLPLISSVIDNLERLARLNKSLLLLSKINNRQFGAELEIDFNQLISKTVENFSDLAAHRNISITFHAKEKFTQKMNPDLASILLTNLLKNAIHHNHSGGFVNITSGKNFLIIKNSGKSAPLDSGKIFERFHKDQASRNSTGLGLSIVQAIVQYYGFSIRYEYQDNHVMVISF